MLEKAQGNDEYEFVGECKLLDFIILGACFIFDTKKREGDFHQQKLPPLTQLCALLKLASSCFSRSPALHKGDDVIFSLPATWPACRSHCLHADTSALAAWNDCAFGIELHSFSLPRLAFFTCVSTCVPSCSWVVWVAFLAEK